MMRRVVAVAEVVGAGIEGQSGEIKRWRWPGAGVCVDEVPGL